MDSIIISLGWLGMFAPLALGAVGSGIGCARAGMAACGALLDLESGYGRFIGVAAMPSSQTIYGIVVTMALRRELTIDNSPGIFGIGVLTGLALMISAFAQGSTCAAAINASKNKLEIFGISLAPAALVEGFSVFSFVFALVLSGGIPK
ncbi:ATP synthase subunit C [Methylobacter sp.]|uniref:ATP synthase subunit C n=1 Tax=Methylobacter sp. TaxID=2051955 RepID=UPI003DA3D914